MKKIIHTNELIKLLPNTDSLDSPYLSWAKFNKSDFIVFDLIGKIFEASGNILEYDTDINYWSENYPISFDHYPNSGADVYFDGMNYYIIYREYGGHVPEIRCRLIRKSLIVKEKNSSEEEDFSG